MMVAFHTIALLIIVLYFWIKSVKRRDLPPGPTPLPIIGNAHQLFWGLLMGKSHIEVCLEWKRRYGNVFTIYVGPFHNVVFADYKTVVEAFVKNAEDYAARPWSFLFNDVRNNKGISFASGPGWLEQRRFSLKTLRDFGFGRNIMQQRILDEFRYRTGELDRQFRELKGKSMIINPRLFLDILIASIVNRVLVGYRYDEGHMDEFQILKLALDQEFETMTLWDTVFINKTNYKLPGFYQRYKMIGEQQEVLVDHMQRTVVKRREEIASGSHLLDIENDGEDYLDAYYIMLDKKKKNDEFTGWFSDEALAANLSDLWMAGTQTTIVALLWFFVFALNDLAVQKKLREESYSITKGDRDVELTDRPNMPYTNAVVTEVLRCGSILNFSFLRETTKETVVEGHVLPKKTSVVAQISIMFRDDKDYPDPGKFDPERFLRDKNLSKQVIAFGAGKRVCVGESLARAELFLIITNFVQKYKFWPLEELPPPTEELNSLLLLKKARPFLMNLEKVC
ncbi:hypothetical protein QR680_010226 [Steinernema hermaphroditum]|uniref:Cytochrome P450 n=1 Tax=Steinernema hermaphroditum TaxID=289476 RepID=A0AA39MAB1_9BILA|nr:hypothetical protein QR680_010226 [Steinernema hermaphroditum]